MNAWIRLLLRHRVVVAAILLASFGLAVWTARTVRIRFVYRDFYDYPGNPHIPLFNKYTQDFGDPAGYVVILIEAKEVFAADVIDYIDHVTRKLEPERTFSRVRSLTNAKAIFAENESVVSGPLFTALPATPEALARARRIALGSSLLLRRLISEDATTTAVLAEMRTPAANATVDEQKAAIEIAEQAAAAFPVPPGVRTWISGAPVVEVETTHALLRDQMVFTPLAIFIICAMLWVTFRSIQGIVLPMVAVLVAVGWTAGIFALYGRPVDIIGSVAPATLLVYGVVDPIFVYTRFLKKIELGQSREDAITSAFSELALPCFLTSLTTALGFAAFATSKLPSIANFGRTVAIGVSLAWVTTVTVLPLAISIMPTPSARLDNLRTAVWLDRQLGRLWGFLGRHVRAVLAVAAAVATIGLLLNLHPYISTAYVGNLPRGEILDTVRILEKKLSGVTRTVIYFEGEPGSMKRPDVLRAIQRIDAFAEKQPLVGSSISLADLVGEENVAFHFGDASQRVIPKSQALVSQLLTLNDPQDLSDFVDADYSHTHIPLLHEDRGTYSWHQMVAAIEGEIAREPLFKEQGIRVSLTGYAYAAYMVLDDIVIEILVGFITAFAIIVVLELLLFRSLRLALISVVPNLIPVLASFTVLRFFHLPLGIDSSLFLSISIGGLFNTTIHFAARCQQRLREGSFTPDEVIDHTIRTVGPPALFTAAVLSFGFSVFLFSNFGGLRTLGWLSMLTLTAGFFSDMILTSVSMRAFFKFKRS
jgi:predicted RND superfamily exporter protein